LKEGRRQKALTALFNGFSTGHPSAFILYGAGLHGFALTGAKTVKKEMGTA